MAEQDKNVRAVSIITEDVCEYFPTWDMVEDSGKNKDAAAKPEGENEGGPHVLLKTAYINQYSCLTPIFPHPHLISPTGEVRIDVSS
jgi:hypothetical protein